MRQIETLVLFACVIIVGALALRHLRRVARPDEPRDRQPGLRAQAVQAVLLSFGFALLRIPVWVLFAAIALAYPPWGVVIGGPTLRGQAILSAGGMVINMGLTVPLFVSAAAAALGRTSPSVLNVVKALRFAWASRSYFRYWGLSWLVWLILAAAEISAAYAVPAPFRIASGSVQALVLSAMTWSVGLLATGHFLGLWARTSMPEEGLGAITGLDTDVEQPRQADEAPVR